MDELTILNRALTNTGNQTLTALNEGSDEWLVASSAFEEAIDDLISRHNWPFARIGTTLVVASDEDNPSVRFENAYLLPASVVHVKAVLVSDGAGNNVPLTDYEIVGRYVCVNGAEGIAIEGIAAPSNANWHPQATKILTMYVEAGCLRGLNEDFAAADNREAMAENRLFEARPRTTRQNPAANAFVSSVARARRGRLGSRNLPTSAGIGSTGTTPPDGSVLLDD